jgi:Radical SAM superfamily
MANLAISAVCNQACAYCFTVDHLTQAGPAFISPAAFDERLAFLARSGIGEARLLGGEPTLHPHFPDLVHRARSAGLKVRVFTNGLLPGPALACLEALAPDDCTVMVNITPPAAGGDAAHAQQRETLRRLGRRALPGFNIYRPDFQLDFLLPLIAGTGCQPAIRLGLAQPCLSGANEHIHPNQYRAVAVRIARFAPIAARVGVALDFDCGFVRCAFSDADLDALRTAGARIGWRCSPILDLDLQGQAIHCYPLARLASLPLTPQTDAAALRSAFEACTRPYRQAGVFPECSACPLKASGECPGGCLAATIRRFRRTPFTVEVTP